MDSAFGPAFHYFRETGAQIPNGVISRWPILAAGEWPDPQVSNRDFVWARIDLPGTNDHYVVSVHLHASGGASSRKLEADAIKPIIKASFPAGSYVVVAGDFNFDARTEAGMGVFKTFLVDDLVPTDGRGDPDTNNVRNKPYDHVLTSTNWRTNLVATRLSVGGPACANGLVFDSRVHSPLSEVAPVRVADSGHAQHMAVVKNFSVRHTLTNLVEVTPPKLALQAGLLRWSSAAGLAWRVELTTNLTEWTAPGRVLPSGELYTFQPPTNLPDTSLIRVAYP